MGHFTSLKLQREPYVFEQYFNNSNYRTAQCLVENTLRVIFFRMRNPSMSRRVGSFTFAVLKYEEARYNLQVEFIEELQKKKKRKAAQLFKFQEVF